MRTPFARFPLTRRADRRTGVHGWHGVVTAALLACGGCSAEAPQSGDVAAAPEPAAISGVYEVKGITRPLEGPGQKRRIAGTVILKQDGGRYSATFKLDTTFPDASEPVHADVIGHGEGDIVGRTLTGTTRTQLVVSTVPGVDTDFAFIPRIVGARIVSSSVTEIRPDGSVEIELENQPAEGEDYRPTHTRLTGHRVAEAASAREIATRMNPDERE